MTLFQGWTRLLEAVRGNGRPLRTLLSRILAAAKPAAPAFPMEAAIEVIDPPRTLDRDARVRLAVRVRNSGREAWPERGRFRVELAYRWLDHALGRVISDGDRLPLPGTIGPGRWRVWRPGIIVPDVLGDLCLQLELRRANADNGDNQGTRTHLPVLVNDPPARDCDYVAWYRRANLERDPWRIVGPATKEQFEELSRAQLRILLDLGLTPSTAVLDVGCGTGKLAGVLEDFLDSGGCYVGTDIGAEAITFCRSRFRRPNFRFVVGEMTTLPIAEIRFDVISFFSVFTHTYPDETRALLGEARRLLKPKGVMVADVFVSPLVKHTAGRRGAVELNGDLFPGMAADVGLRAELLENLCHPWGRYGRRVFYRITRDSARI